MSLVPYPLPTPSPTPDPSPAPTILPLPLPTSAPFPIPTAVPFPSPTPRPTFVPSPHPTKVPIPGPTGVPVPQPTPMPTDVGCTDGRRNGDESDVSALLLPLRPPLSCLVRLVAVMSQNAKQQPRPPPSFAISHGACPPATSRVCFQLDCGGTCPACNAGEKCNGWSDCSTDTCDGASGICLTRAPTFQPTDAPTLQPTVTPCEWLDVPLPPQLSVAKFSSTGGQARALLSSFLFVLFRSVPFRSVPFRSVRLVSFRFRFVFVSFRFFSFLAPASHGGYGTMV